MAEEAQYVRELGAIDPHLVAPFNEATAAMDAEQFGVAEEKFRRVLQGAPHSDVVMRRLGICLVIEGKREEGLYLCQAATVISESVNNLYSYAYALRFTNAAEPLRNDVIKAAALLQKCRAMPDGETYPVLFLLTEVLFHLEDREGAAAVVETMQAKFPDEAGTHYFAAFLLAGDEHWIRAEREIDRAEKLGLSHEAAQRFRDSGVRANARWWFIALYIGIAVGVWAAGMVFLMVTGLCLSFITLLMTGRSDPRRAVSSGERLQRLVYRAVIAVAGVYYYLSLPIVLVIVLSLAGVVLVASLSAGVIVFKLVIFVVIGAGATVYSLVRSMLVRVRDSDPGRPLRLEEAEGLWLLAGEVARSVGTRPIDEIRITPGVELAVYERGSWREKLHDKGKRVLILGVGVLKDFKIDDFRAVLAHEYGHFSHRDTAGGEIAIRVRNDMLKFYFAMSEAGQATYYNLAFHFLRVYYFLFRRITHGATRLQEILADRVAAQQYGAAAFEGGLRHVIRRSIELDTCADAEAKECVRAMRPLMNFYDAVPENSEPVEKGFEKAFDAKTTADDTHPGPRDRIRLIASLNRPVSGSLPGEVWHLFRNREEITREMLVEVEKNVTRYRHIDDPNLKV